MQHTFLDMTFSTHVGNVFKDASFEQSIAITKQSASANLDSLNNASGGTAAAQISCNSHSRLAILTICVKNSNVNFLILELKHKILSWESSHITLHCVLRKVQLHKGSVLTSVCNDSMDDTSAVLPDFAAGK